MLFSRTFFRVEVIRQLRNPFTLAFTIVMPVVMYLIFGASADYTDQSVGNGNVSFYVMASMATFGTATAMTSLCSLAAAEVRQGWGRQIAMTRLSIAGYALVKMVTAVCFAALSTAIVFTVGALTGASADGLHRWVLVMLLILAGGFIFGLFGLGVGLSFNSDSGTALASISITFFSFFGNVFMPLSGMMLQIAHFTPMYGYVALARWPITGGVLVDGGTDQLWMPIANIVAWALIFAALARYGVIRSRRRQ